MFKPKFWPGMARHVSGRTKLSEELRGYLEWKEKWIEKNFHALLVDHRNPYVQSDCRIYWSAINLEEITPSFSQLTFTCSKSTMEILKKCLKYVQS